MNIEKKYWKLGHFTPLSFGINNIGKYGKAFSRRQNCTEYGFSIKITMNCYVVSTL